MNKYDGIEEPVFKNIGLDYSESTVEFVWTKKNENIAINEIKKLIEKEGFEFTFLAGTFYGSFEDNENLHFILTNLDLPIDIESTKKFNSKKMIALKGKLTFNQQKALLSIY